MAGLDDLIAQLRSVSEDLADRAISVLSEASRAGETRRPEAERALTQARRAVEKAIAILERQSQQPGDE
jgi:N-acetylmuramic acid 6-phosphate (MurNAc-6-P) etherase